MVVQKRAQPQAQLFGEISFFERVEKGHGGTEGPDEGGAFGAAGKVLVQLGPDIRGQTAIKVVGQEGDDPRTIRRRHFNLKL